MPASAGIENEGDLLRFRYCKYAGRLAPEQTALLAGGFKALVLDSAKSFTGVKDGIFFSFIHLFTACQGHGNSVFYCLRNTPM